MSCYRKKVLLFLRLSGGYTKSFMLKNFIRKIHEGTRPTDQQGLYLMLKNFQKSDVLGLSMEGQNLYCAFSSSFDCGLISEPYSYFMDSFNIPIISKTA